MLRIHDDRYYRVTKILSHRLTDHLPNLCHDQILDGLMEQGKYLNFKDIAKVQIDIWCL